MKNIITIVLALFISVSLIAQDTETVKKENKNKTLLGYFMLNDSKPMTTYEGGLLIDNQTSYIPSKKTLEFMIQHRFGSMENGISDFFGIYGTANTRLALNYSIMDWLQVGFGTTKNYKLQDFSLKANLLKQSKDGKSPVDVTYYGNFSIDARDESYFGEDYKFGNRVAYFNELLVSRKFCDWFTASFGGSFTHFNQADSLIIPDDPSVALNGSYEHDKIALHFIGRIKFSPQSALIINCDLPLKIEGIKEWDELANPPVYNFGFGYEVTTATHVFQIFAGSATNLSSQYNVMKNHDEFFKNIDNVFIGFNISRVWNF
jgi:hypothetical protein